MYEEGRERNIWAIGGGKGGSGKSFVTVNLGIALSERGKEVILVDADLGGANLHNLLGITNPSTSLDDFIRRDAVTIKDILTETEVPNLKMVTGSIDILTMSNPKFTQKQKVIRHISSLDADYIILDLGAGVSYHVLDFFLISERGIFVVTPEPTSLENAYRFLRGVFFRRLSRITSKYEIKKVIESAMDRGNPEGIRTPFDLIERVEEVDRDVGMLLKEEIKRFHPQLIVNQVRNRGEAEIGFFIKSACKKYFGIELSYLGYILYDHNVYLSIQKGRPLLLNNPTSEAAKCIRDITTQLIDGGELGWFLN